MILSGIASRQKKSGHLLFLPRTRGDKWLSFIGEISHSPLISPCLRAPLLRNQTTKEQLHEKLLSAITTFTFLLIFLLSSILAVDRADTGWRGLQRNLLRLTMGRYYCAQCCVWRRNVWTVSSVSVSGWSLCRMATVCFLCRCRCGSVAPAEALVPASPPHNQPLYTVLYCTVLHVYTHYFLLCTIIASTDIVTQRTYQQ